MIALYKIIDLAFDIYTYMVIAYVFMSWFPQMRETTIGRLLERLVEPFLAPFRRFIPTLGVIDLSPIVALFALHFAKIGLFSLINMVAG